MEKIRGVFQGSISTHLIAYFQLKYSSCYQGSHTIGMDTYLLPRLFLLCIGILYAVDAKNEYTPGWLRYIDFHLRQPLQEYFRNSRDSLRSPRESISSIYFILEHYIRFTRQRCDISFCNSPCLYQDRSWHTTTTTWPCGALCHDHINKTASCEWRIKLNSRMRLDISIINMQVPLGSIDHACNKDSIKLVEGMDRPRKYHWCNSMYNVMTKTGTGNVTIRIYVLPEWREAEVFSALYQVIDPIHTRYMQTEEDQLGEATLGGYSPFPTLLLNEQLFLWWSIKVGASSTARVALKENSPCQSKEFSLSALDRPTIFPSDTRYYKAIPWFPIADSTG